MSLATDGINDAMVKRVAAIRRANGEAVPVNMGAMLSEIAEGSDLYRERTRWLAIGEELSRIGRQFAEAMKRIVEYDPE